MPPLSVIDLASQVVAAATRELAAAGSIDDHQVLAYDLAHAASAVETARGLLDYGNKGDLEGRITCAFVADAVHDLASKMFGREADWGVEPGALDGARPFLTSYRAAEFLAAIDDPGPRHLSDDFELVQDTFRRFADEKLKPIAEHIHRDNADIPESIIAGLAEMGGVRPVDPRRVRRLRRGRRRRVHRHGRGHRGAVARLARRRRFAHHPTGDPGPGAAGRRHRGAEARRGCRSWRPPR